MIIGSVGHNGFNLPIDVAEVQRRLNAHAPPGQTMLDVDGRVSGPMISMIERFQTRKSLRAIAPLGRVNPGSLSAQILASAGSGAPTPAPTPQPSSNLPPKHPAMRQSAWEHLLKFTKKHEDMVLHMFNGDKIKLPDGTEKDDVTCGLGFRMESEDVAAQQWVRTMFYDPSVASFPQATPEQMKADYRAAAAIVRTWTKGSMEPYKAACKMRMHEAKVIAQWGNFVRDQKLPTAFSQFPDDYKEFASFPAAAQAVIASFLYGNNSATFPKLRAAIRAKDFREAANQCSMVGMKGNKNQAHKDLFLHAQKVVDEKLDLDDLPPL